jgi:phospholipase/carboxylesterase
MTAHRIHDVSRRDFVKTGLSVLAAPVLAGCGFGFTDPEPGDNTPTSPRLSARPGSPTETPTTGLSSLGFASGRDGVLYVPASYSPDTPLPLLVGLHGAGGEGRNWESYYARAEARGMVFLAPDSRDYTWDLILGRFGADVEFLDGALRYTFERCNIDPARIALAGFSDGATYSLSLGSSNGDLFSHLVAYSPGYWGTTERVGMPLVYISHGTEDQVLPVVLSRNTIVPSMEGAGYDVTYEEFQGGHEVPAAISESALDWFLA